MKRTVFQAFLLALLLAGAACAQTPATTGSAPGPVSAPPVQITVLTDPPAAIAHISYGGKLIDRTLPIAVIKTGTDYGTLRVPMHMNAQGLYEGNAVLDREGTYKASFEGDDLILGGHKVDDNNGNLYGFEVTNQATRDLRERSFRDAARRQIRITLREEPRFKDAAIFFNNRQPADARVAVVRGADGLRVWRVSVDNATHKVRVLERVK